MGGRGSMASLFLAALTVAACAGGETAPTDVAPTTSTAPPSGVATEPTTTTAPAVTTSEPVPSDDSVANDEPNEPNDDTGDVEELLARDPLVIFNAYPPKPDHITYELPRGQHDFFELWAPGAPWQTALEHVDVYRLHAFQMRHFLDDEQLLTLVEFLREHDIALMFETEPLIPPTECDHGESFEAPWDLEMAVRLKELGGRIDVIAIEQPYTFAHLLDRPGACQYSVERIVGEVMEHVGNLRELFGDVPVGSIEGIWASPDTEPRDMEIWLDTFEEIAGEPFAFLHVDPDWYRPDWAEVAVGIEAVADARGVPFGILYNGGKEFGGQPWMDFMMANAAELEMEHGGTPRHVSFQSWVDWPDHTLPEDDLSALTSGIVRYFGERIELALEASEDGLVVRAAGPDGRPVEGVQVHARRDGGDSVLTTRTVGGLVPGGATEAMILIRANAEDAVPGTAVATLYDVSFTDGVGGTDLVPNGSFDAGIEDWGVYGSNPGGVGSVSSGSDRGLAVRAAPDQDVFIDGAGFPVTAGSEFELSVTYLLDGGDPDSVVVSVEFPGLSRSNVFLRDLPVELGEFVTGPDGTTIIPSDLVGTSPTEIEVLAAGDLTHWPATSSIQVN